MMPWNRREFDDRRSARRYAEAADIRPGDGGILKDGFTVLEQAPGYQGPMVMVDLGGYRGRVSGGSGLYQVWIEGLGLRTLAADGTFSIPVGSQIIRARDSWGHESVLFTSYAPPAFYTQVLARVSSAPVSDFCQQVGAQANGDWICTLTGPWTPGAENIYASPTVPAANGTQAVYVFVNSTRSGPQGSVSNGILVTIDYPVVPSPCGGAAWGKSLSAVSPGYVGPIPNPWSSYVDSGSGNGEQGTIEILEWIP